MKIILASASPRRRELLESIGLSFEVRPSSVPELPEAGEDVDTYVRRLARAKAEEIASASPDAWVIAADTVVYIGAELLEKPGSREDAIRMLERICGERHTVYTGLTLKHSASGYSETTVTTSEVWMLPLSRPEIEWYVDTGEPMDKAGAYAVQGIGAMFIERINGNYTNVVGLPLAALFEMMKKAGIPPIGATRPETAVDPLPAKGQES
jgi:septum formation protein